MAFVARSLLRRGGQQALASGIGPDSRSVDRRGESGASRALALEPKTRGDQLLAQP